MRHYFVEGYDLQECRKHMTMFEDYEKATQKYFEFCQLGYHAFIINQEMEIVDCSFYNENEIDLDTYEPDDSNLECGFNPYSGCYDYDC